jgi:hypothetical protein
MLNGIEEGREDGGKLLNSAKMDVTITGTNACENKLATHLLSFTRNNKKWRLAIVANPH